MKYIHYADTRTGKVKDLEFWYQHYSKWGYMSFAECLDNITPVTRGVWGWNMVKKRGRWVGLKRCETPNYVEIAIPDFKDIAMYLFFLMTTYIAINNFNYITAASVIFCLACLVIKCRFDLKTEGSLKK